MVTATSPNRGTIDMSTLPDQFSYAGGGGAPPGQTLRNIATRCRPNQQLFTTTSVQTVWNRTYHTNLGNTTAGVQVVTSNWMATSTGEVAGPSATVEACSIEYPTGIFSIGSYGGAPTGTCAPGANLVSDMIPVIIPAGAGFFVNTIKVFTGNFQQQVSMNAVTCPQEPTGVTKYWTTTTWAASLNDPRAAVCGTNPGSSSTSGWGAFTIYPTAILALSNIPSVLVLGDSRCGGLNDANGGGSNTQPGDFNYWGMGEICRSIGRSLPYTNAGIPSDTIQQFNATPTFRSSLQAYHTHVHFEYPINDLTAGRTGAVVQAALQSAYALFPTKQVSQSTIPPVTTSTDNWATVANQTISASNTARVFINDWIRTKPSPLWAYFEVANVVENGQDTGKWKATDSTPPTPAAITSDGTHETPWAYQAIQQAGVINTSLFHN